MKMKKRIDEVKCIFKLALPIMFSQLFRFINPSISLGVCGQFSAEELDAVSLGITIINAFGLCVDTGFSSAFDTLFSQAYGSQQKAVMGVVLQRAVCVVLCIFSFIFCLHINVEPILLLLGQDPLISSLTSEYLICFLPGLLFDFIFLSFGRYLQAQNLVLPMTCASLIGVTFNLIGQYIVFKLALGLQMSAICVSCSFAVMLLCELVYIFYTGTYNRTYAPLNLVSALRNWWPILRLGIPGVFMIALEEWCFELMTIIAGTMGTVTLGAQAITFQIQSLIYMTMLGIFISVNVRVGQELGANNPMRARYSYHTALLIIPFFILLSGLPVTILRHQLPYIFTSDNDIAVLTSQLLPMLLLLQICEGFAGVSEGVLLACGRQNVGATTIFTCYYFIGLPISYTLVTYTNLGIFGALIGLTVGFSITTICYTIMALKTDWIKEARKTRIRLSLNYDATVPCLLMADVNGTTNGLPDIHKDRTLNYPFEQARVPLRKKVFLFAIALMITFAVNLRLTRPTPYWKMVCNSQFNATLSQMSFCERMW